MVNDFDITTIEDTLKGIVRNWGVSDSIYNNRPRAIDAKTNKQDFVVVKISGAIDDQITHGETTVSIHLFAKDIQSEKNGKKLSFMYQKVIENLPGETERILFGIPRIVADSADNYGYHARVINIPAIIKLKQ